MKTKPAITIRKMRKFKVTQRKRDMFFNANDFLRLWNRANPKAKHTIVQFLKLDKTKDFIKELLKTAEKPVSEINLVRDGGTWFAPLLFQHFVCWVNPAFAVEAQLLILEHQKDVRQEAANNYVKLSSVANKLKGFDPEKDYRTLAIGLQYVIFGYEGKNLLDKANETVLKERHVLESNLIFTIEMGFVTEFDQLLNILRFLHRKKFPKSE